MNLFDKGNKRPKYNRRSFIKTIGPGTSMLVFPQVFTGSMFGGLEDNKPSGLYSNGGIDTPIDKITSTKNILLYHYPADVKSYPLHAMPVGNGSMGLMFSGHVHSERIILNHNRLRPIFYKEKENNVSNYLPLVRELFFDGRYGDAQATFNKMQLENGGKRLLNNYHQVSDLFIEMPNISDVSGYKRMLDLGNGIGKVTFESKGVNYIKTYFSSAPDNLHVINISASRGKSISCTIALGRLPFESCALDGFASSDMLSLKGEYTEGLCFEVSVKLINQGGNITPGQESYKGNGRADENGSVKLLSLNVSEADELTILTSIRVSRAALDEGDRFSGYNFRGLAQQHIKDFEEKTGRVKLNLTGLNNGKALANTDEFLKKAREGIVHPKLIELIFQEGRYTLLSCSRSGGLPVNLQGLWSNAYSPVWNSRYQLDMNLQMCYWLANPVNLNECNLPLFDYLEGLVPAAIKRSKDLYNCRGISLPVGVDENNVRYPSNSETQCVAGWLAQHFWEHYLFTLDEEFLAKRAYPFMLLVGEFFEDYLFENEEKRYIILPSSSPENYPGNFPGRLSMNATIDIAVVKELFNNLIKASHTVGVDGQKRRKWHKIVRKLPSWPVGGDGTLLEWADNNAIERQEHRHLSHLYPLYPGSLFDTEDTPELVAAAIKAIKKRESVFHDDACGWSYAWLVALYARAGMAEDAYRNLLIYAQGFITADNLLSTICDLSGLGLGRTRNGKLIQVEAGLGITAAIAEMLLQSHNGLIRILPALPNCWGNGLVEGLKARGNYEIDILWETGKIHKVIVRSNSDSVFKIKFYKPFRGEVKLKTNDKSEIEYKKIADNTYAIKTKTNLDYEFYSN